MGFPRVISPYLLEFTFHHSYDDRYSGPTPCKVEPGIPISYIQGISNTECRSMMILLTWPMANLLNFWGLPIVGKIKFKHLFQGPLAK